MGGGSSKGGGGLKDDAPPPPPPPAADAAKEEKNFGKMQQRIKATEKKVMEDQHTKVDEDVSDSSDEGGAYDSDLERQLDADAQALKAQEPEDDHKRIAIQDRARADAMQVPASACRRVLAPVLWLPAHACAAGCGPTCVRTRAHMHSGRRWCCRRATSSPPKTASTSLTRTSRSTLCTVIAGGIARCVPRP